MDHHQIHQADPSQPDFTAFDAAVRARLPQHTTLPPGALEAVARLGRLVQTLRTKQHWSLQTLAAQTGLPWLWLALLEQGMLLPGELTPEAVQKLGQAFPTQHAAARPEVLFHALAEDLLHCQVPPKEAEPPHDHAEATRPTLRDHLGGLVQWVSEFWCPPLAGAVVTAAETPEQTHIYYLDEGLIEVAYAWSPAGIRITWRADVTQPREFWVRFAQPDDATGVLAEVCLGHLLAGEITLSTQDLGFDPTTGTPWAAAVVPRETER